MVDRLYNGRRCGTLNVIDEGNRVFLAIEIGTTLPSLRMIAVLEALIALHGHRGTCTSTMGQNSFRLPSRAWCEARDIHLRYIQLGNPSQSAFIERFNRTYRTKITDAYMIASFTTVRDLTSEWLYCYNTQRPHDGLAHVPPLTYRS